MRPLLALLLCLPSFAYAWGFEGHRIIVEIAEQHLTVQAKHEVEALMKLEDVRNLLAVAVWADETKTKSTATWHYVYLPRPAGCKYNKARDCPDGNCIVEVLKKQLEVYRTSPSPRLRLKALRYLVHLVSDIHQPLNAGFKDDQGGNRYQLSVGGHNSNLHRVWDVELVNSSNSKNKSAVADMHFRPEAWAEESCRIAAGHAFYPAHELTASYVKLYRPIAEERLTVAGLRLAALLNKQ